ncbi:pancreatic triacylglycerol lipase [Procambarus clarkii]|uniref:pancreatic triacylglycerol lipase n=1 Tax=Procambarus clarkii TaxID=6728 RepID=UPI001E673D4D|nr:pancreatic triacylglycerol lipase-like [Procambarus clarkii]
MSGQGNASTRIVQVFVLAVVVVVAPAATQTMLDLLSRITQDLPALSRAINTSPYFNLFPKNSALLARSGSSKEPLEEICFGELGCLETTADFFHPWYRPVNLQPESREAIGVVYRFYSSEDLKGVSVPALQLQNILNSSFRPNRKTKIILHGYLTGKDAPWMMNIARAFLHVADFNVVMMDWTAGSLGMYEQSVANARVAGLEVAHLIHWLQDHTGHKPQDVHLICYSLGAHVCGYAGERVSGLGRITGLDPAQPQFQHMPARVRLDPSDALFVDVIHTDTIPFTLFGGYGLREPLGHVDFYPNDGLYQPGCQSPVTRWMSNNDVSKFSKAVEDALGCSHMRSAALFTDSIISQCSYMAFACDSYQKYQAGECFSCGENGTRCARMGIQADTWLGTQPVGQMFISTGSANKLCLYHYRLRLELEKAGARSRAGSMKLSFFTTAGLSWTFTLSIESTDKIDPDQGYTFLLEHDEELGASVFAKLTWTARRSIACPACDASLPVSSLSLLNIEKSAQRNLGDHSSSGPEEVVLCPGGRRGVLLLGSGDTTNLEQSPGCYYSA